MTEASVFVTIQRDGDVRLDTVGTPITDVEIRLSEQGEVLFKSPGVFLGYAKNPEATRQTLEDGWIHSGTPASRPRRTPEDHRPGPDVAAWPTARCSRRSFSRTRSSSPLRPRGRVHRQTRPWVTALVNIDLVAVRNWA